MHLVIGNKLYSSWSLRAWMLLHAFEIQFDETVIAMYQRDTRERMLAFGPTGKVPVLIDGDVTVWESLAIMEYVADRFPNKRVWPVDLDARAHARSAASEMHAGFTGLRAACPMNLTKRFAPKDRGAACAADVVRLQQLWSEARDRFGGGGPFLYGDFSAADAMFAPVVTRLDTYQVAVDKPTRSYMDTVLAHPAFAAWRASALEEPWQLPHYEEGETAVEVFHRPKYRTVALQHPDPQGSHP
ncbi:glutathione S-transferase family protein [Oricola cellulosilytica]|uniref:Glutathione S-transferase family protein n=1 Tax=Oricola cellulosilytica TaxID=1429082 RepID=A0A4R0PCJ3_9HYPH|nr:glutathione S-transferase family protein [Oricola cellulosilytica]TCD15190.1 glutathione S-transferase family protein [Oricola cellulosilytica]